MGDTSDIKANGIKAGGAAAWRWARSWIVRHWRGELPLAKAFWINGYLLNLVPKVLIWGTISLKAGSTGELPAGLILPLFIVIALFPTRIWQVDLGPGYVASLPWALSLALNLAPMVIALIVMIWQIVGICRSARRYPGRPPVTIRYAVRLLCSAAACALAVSWVYFLPIQYGFSLY